MKRDPVAKLNDELSDDERVRLIYAAMQKADKRLALELLAGAKRQTHLVIDTSDCDCTRLLEEATP